MAQHLMEAAGIIFAPMAFFSILGGVILGIIFGIIPGLTATLAVILLIPVTYGLDPITGIAVLVGVYIGGISGGLVSAILVGMPGTPSSITTVFDGFPLTKMGEARKALQAGITANLVGTVFGGIFLVAIAPQLASLALKFGPFEYMAVILFGFTTVVSLSGDSIVKGVIVTLFGLVCCTIGMDPVVGTPRSTFGFSALESGISPVPAMIGLFVIAEVFRNLEKEEVYILDAGVKINPKSRFSLAEFRASFSNFFRSGLIGVGIGILPGIGGSLANFVAYDQTKKAASDPETFGKGNYQGIVASETANNAVIGGALIPMMALGIPGDVVSAALMGGLQLHGLEPGPMLFAENPTFVCGVYVAFFLSALMMYASMMLAGTRILPRILGIPKKFLLPIVLIASTVGCYNLSYSIGDMWTTLFFGVLGYYLSKYDFPLTPLVISLVLGRMFEKQLRLGLMDSAGSIMPLFTRPLALLFVALAVFSVAFSLYKMRKA